MRTLLLTILTIVLSTITGKAQEKGYEIAGDSVVFTFDLRDYERFTHDVNGRKLTSDELNIDRVYLSGEFNNWSREGWKMTRISPNVYTLKKGLDQFNGRMDWQFKYLVNSTFWAEPDTSFENITTSEKSNFWRSIYNLNLHTIAPDPNGNASFFIEGHDNAEQVILSGSFNKWNEDALKMHKTANGWKLTLNLPPGEHTYKFIVDGEWMHDPKNREKTINEYGGYNSVMHITTPVTFTLKGHEEADRVFLAGSFNDWNPTSIPMEKTEKGWVICTDLTGGKHHYKFVVDGKWITDPANDIREYDGNGHLNSVIMIK